MLSPPLVPVAENGKLSNLLFKSIGHIGRAASGRRRLWAATLFPMVCAAFPAVAAMPDLPDLQFGAASMEYGDVHLRNLRGDLGPGGRFQLAFDALEGPGEGLVGNGLTLEGRLESLESDAGSFGLEARVSALGLHGRLALLSRPSEWRVQLSFADQDAQALRPIPGLPAAAQWIRQGRFDTGLDFSAVDGRPGSLEFEAQLRDLGFDSPDGRYASEALALVSRGTVNLTGTTAFEVEGELQEGEVLLGDFYRNFSDAGLKFAARGEWGSDGLVLAGLGLDDGGGLRAEGAGRIGPAGPDDWSLEISRLELRFPAAYERYIEPMAAAWTLDGLQVTGQLNWSGEWEGGELVRGDLEVGDFSMVDTERERFALTGFEARLRPGDHGYDSQLGWQGLLLGSINLGAGRAMLDSTPGSVALIEPLRLQVLGGTLDLESLKVVLPGGRDDGASEPDILLTARLEGLDMTRLTAALGWPAFGGSISGEIPGVSLDDGVLAVDGEIRFRVFDGLITLQNLGIERPFGVLPSLAADIGISNLDLQQLTSTFSFGQIAGRLDGHISDLRMLDWKPVAFDAWLGTPERQTGASDISRQAVNRLTAIGGGAPTAALTGPLMRMFSSFSYRRLGLGCTLADNICQLRGLSDDGSGVLILEGAGVPKITIRAFNRNIDWPQMVSNLVAISEGESISVGEAPDS